MPDISFLGPAAASVLIVGMFLKYLRDESDRRDEQHDQMIKTLKSVKSQVKENDKYLRDRNGRDAEAWAESRKFNKQLIKEMRSLADRNLDATQNIKDQHVEHQHIKEKK